MDGHAIADDGKLIVGSVRAVGRFDAHQDAPDWGNVEVSVLDLAARDAVVRFFLNSLEYRSVVLAILTRAEPRSGAVRPSTFGVRTAPRLHGGIPGSRPWGGRWR